MSKISIIFYTYNAISSIEKILISMRNQSLQDFVCYIIDGGSTDKTYYIAKSYAILDNRFILIQLNKGQKVGAYNRILDLQKSEYCIFLNQAYIPSNDYLQNIYDIAIEYNADIVSGQSYDEDAMDINVKNPTQSFIQALRYSEDFPLSLQAIKSSIIDNIRFKDYMQYEDRIFLLECIANSSLIVQSNCYCSLDQKSKFIYRPAGKGIYSSNSLDALLYLMNYVQSFNKGLHIYALQHTIIEALKIADTLDSRKSKSQKLAANYAKIICKTYLRWFISSADIPFKIKLKAILLCTSFRSYKIADISSKTTLNSYIRHKTYSKARSKRLDYKAQKSYKNKTKN